MNCDLKSFEKSNSAKSNMKRPPSSESLSAFVQQKKAQPISNHLTHKKLKIDEEMELEDELIANKFIDIQKPVSSSFNNKSSLKPIKQEKNDDYKKSTYQSEDAEFLDYLNSKPLIKPIAQQVIKPLNNNTNLINSKNSFQTNVKSTPSAKVDIIEEEDEDFNVFLNSIHKVKNNPIVKSIEIVKQEIKIESISNLKPKSFIQGCCLMKKPLDSNLFPCLSTCTHLIKGKVSTLTAKLRQIKLKWYQECIIADLTSSLDSYIGDEPMNSLLGLTCAQVKEMHKRSVLSKNSFSQSKEQEEFEKSRKSCETKLEAMKCTMHLKYDFEKEKFSVFKITDIDLTSNKSKENL